MYHAKIILKTENGFATDNVAYGDEFETLEEMREACKCEMERNGVIECQIIQEDEDGIDRLIEIIK